MLKFSEKAKEYCKQIFTLENLQESHNNNSIDQEQREFLESLIKAKEDWLVAKNNFEFLSDKDLIEQAVFAIVAAEKRYIYLLKEAQNKNFTSQYIYTYVGDINKPI